MRHDFNYSELNYTDIGIAQQNITPVRRVTPLWEATSLNDIINTYIEFWHHYGDITMLILFLEVLIIYFIKRWLKERSHLNR